MYCYKLRLQLNNERVLNKDQNKFVDLFKNIANEVLLRNHHSFLNIAQETFHKILETDKSEFNTLVTPIRETLFLFEQKITGIEKDRINAYSDLRRQIKDLIDFNQEIQKETNTLSKALSSPIMSGQWGEMQLRRVVELAGMIPYCDFVEQASAEDSRLRPDMVIRLPGNRCIILDSKAPINDYMKAVNTGDATYMDLHAKRIKSHIKILGQKAYWSNFDQTPEFVLMFLPGESFFSSAVKQDPSLIEYGVSEKVIITTPITLIAILKAISFSWQQEAIAKNAKQIGEIGKLVVTELNKLFEYSKDFEKRMVKNVDEYVKINNFIEKAMIPTAQKLKSLGLEIENSSDILELKE